MTFGALDIYAISTDYDHCMLGNKIKKNICEIIARNQKLIRFTENDISE